MKKIISLMMVLFTANVFAAPKKETPKAKPAEVTEESATFGAGCFWCVQPTFDKAEGVIKTNVGFSGGKDKDPTYAQVSTGKTGHAEAIEVVFDPKKTSYEKILDIYWNNVDPTDGGGQYADRGSQYRPVIFYRNAEQEKAALASKKKVEDSKQYSRPIAVQIVPFTFFSAVKGKDEELHEKYYIKNPKGFELYEKGSGRTKELQKINR